jgi:hypothetical protein
MKPTYFPSHQPIPPPMEMLSMINTFFMPNFSSYSVLWYLGVAGKLQNAFLAKPPPSSMLHLEFASSCQGLAVAGSIKDEALSIKGLIRKNGILTPVIQNNSVSARAAV